ncbi:hypothetical protein CRG98_023605, partial [Punica granatum]
MVKGAWRSPTIYTMTSASESDLVEVSSLSDRQQNLKLRLLLDRPLNLCCSTSHAVAMSDSTTVPPLPKNKPNRWPLTFATIFL